MIDLYVEDHKVVAITVVTASCRGSGTGGSITPTATELDAVPDAWAGLVSGLATDGAGTAPLPDGAK